MNTNTLRILSLEIVISVTNERGRLSRREALCDRDESLQPASHPRVPRQQRLGRAPGGFLEDFPAERERLGELAVASNPTLGGYPEKMDRRIPLITLEQQGV